MTSSLCCLCLPVYNSGAIASVALPPDWSCSLSLCLSLLIFTPHHIHKYGAHSIMTLSICLEGYDRTYVDSSLSPPLRDIH